MPAVTADTATLPRLPELGPDQRDRPVRSVTTAPQGHEGEGFPGASSVRRCRST